MIQGTYNIFNNKLLGNKFNEDNGRPPLWPGGNIVASEPSGAIPIQINFLVEIFWTFSSTAPYDTSQDIPHHHMAIIYSSVYGRDGLRH